MIFCIFEVDFARKDILQVELTRKDVLQDFISAFGILVVLDTIQNIYAESVTVSFFLANLIPPTCLRQAKKHSALAIQIRHPIQYAVPREPDRVWAVTLPE